MLHEPTTSVGLMKWLGRLAAGLVIFMAFPALAQLKDETPAERDAQILTALLPGTFSNGEQVYFDTRLNLPTAERAPLLSARFEIVALAANGPRAIKLTQGTNVIFYILSLDRGPLTVRWGAYRPASGTPFATGDAPALASLTAAPQCDLLSRREAGQFRAVSIGACPTGPQELLVSERAIWWRPSQSAPSARLNRARQFDCYVDMPGSGGIMGETFHRFSDLKVDDQGTEAWFTTLETTPRQLGLRLRAVDWPMNNKAGTYTRDSLTLYLIEAQANGPPKNITYAFTEPTVRRIGLNTIAILANCYMDSPTTAKPEF